MEPLIIATNRQLSVVHPIHKLLKPHFRNTLHVNAVARQIVFGAGDRRKNGDVFRGIQEVTYLASKYAMEMSSKAYKNWNFTELALPADLVKRYIYLLIAAGSLIHIQIVNCAMNSNPCFVLN
jgi:linoleate 9S-lipoxygenase